MQVVEELHDARSKDSLSLVERYGELTSMDLATDSSVEVATEGPGEFYLCQKTPDNNVTT